MACYQCNGEGGDETRLCPRCNAERRSGHRSLIAATQASSSPSIFRQINIVQAVALIAAVAGSVYFVGYSSLGPGLALSKGELMYKRCLDKMAKVATASPRMAPRNAHEAAFFEQAKKAFSKQVTERGPEMCEKMKAECTANPSGKKCASMKFF